MRCFIPPADTRFYTGVDLHARALFHVVLDRDFGMTAGSGTDAYRDRPGH
jgi:hypothetical protein